MRNVPPLFPTNAPLVLALAAMMSGAFLLTPLHAADDDLSTPHLEVFGTVERAVVPDELIWNLAVETYDEDQNVAAARHRDSLKALLEHLRKSGIDEKDLKTGQTRFDEDTRVEDHKHVRIGYDANTRVQFKTRDLDAYADQWLSLATMPDVNIRSVEMETSERTEIQGELRLEAMGVAREKARAMAAIYDMEIGQPLVIEEIPPSTYGSGSWTMSNTLSNYAFYDSGNGGGSDDVFAAGTIAMSRQVRVVFALRARAEDAAEGGTEGAD